MTISTVHSNYLKTTGIEINFQVRQGQPTPTTLDEVATLINLIGTNIKTLRITFIDYKTISPSLIKSIGNLKKLKSIEILFMNGKLNNQNYDPNALSSLLGVLPAKLEHLHLYHYPRTI
ncbi:uncharacterized protein MELLADRAFT_104621 [Melampsora larici-populina 98AG31]|uniref:Uncharacterized protein n=1 Tax=Melampsora larici-populina (strain 98AG31 / pathotype 3-4-7) TaxID=747676 RepID=F4RFB7_MELLP|nr:uncharacterized protein MELLADRAFT_104621 [Melampsora larici-populina 98AG31]EGG08786.1 hypothetical protein MELLADRAFT_104621 [Melampsora larici-populina 98AG31]